MTRTEVREIVENKAMAAERIGLHSLIFVAVPKSAEFDSIAIDDAIVDYYSSSSLDLRDLQDEKLAFYIKRRDKVPYVCYFNGAVVSRAGDLDYDKITEW